MRDAEEQPCVISKNHDSGLFGNFWRWPSPQGESSAVATQRRCLPSVFQPVRKRCTLRATRRWYCDERGRMSGLTLPTGTSASGTF